MRAMLLQCHEYPQNGVIAQAVVLATASSQNITTTASETASASLHRTPHAACAGRQSHTATGLRAS